MKNYFDPEMNITLFDAENVVTEASTTIQQAQQQFFGVSTIDAGNDGSAAVNAQVDASNVLSFR